MKHLLILLMAAGLAAAQTETRGASSQTGLFTASGGVDASAATIMKPPKGTSDPVACDQGQVFYRTDTNKLRKCTSSGVWADAEGSVSSATAGYGISISGTAISYDPTDPRQDPLDDNFHAPVGTADSFSVGALNWRYGHSGTCSASLYSASAWEDFGEWEVTSGGTSGNGCWLNHQTGGYGPAQQFYPNSDKPFDILWRVKLDSNASIVFYVGLQGLYNGDPPGDKGVYFRFSTTASDTNFMLVSRASSTDTAVSTGVAANTTYNWFRIYSDGATANKLYATVNGGTALTICASGCDITTNISTTGRMQPFVAVFTATTGTKKMTVEKFMMNYVTSTAAR
ncbi:MAG: hypothetical protein ABFD89_02230 [Bryobacteraceae bacterium]